MTMKHKWWIPIGVLAALAVAGVAVAKVGSDFGQQTQRQMLAQSQALFGFSKPPEGSSTADLDEAQALADPTALVTLAKGLKASVVAAGAADDVAPNMDQMVLWPPSNPTYVIGLNEEDPTDPGLQKVNLETGEATTIVSGTADGDPVRVSRGERSCSARRPVTRARCTSSSTR